ncbi:hypothetical protein ACFXKJ_41150 [Kitasatospora indigofera]|uniref:hypothetical protein n=1 Tax=Kitasatospora indigofera TaxID=67307 RepID=UPI003683F1C0
MINEEEITWLAHLAGQSTVADTWIEDEHIRYDIYRKSLASSSFENETRIAEIIARDPDRFMGQAALVDHVDRLANDPRAESSFTERTEAIAQLAQDFDFLIARIREWRLIKTAEKDPNSTIGDILSGSHWMQRMLADNSNSQTVLTALIEEGQTRRIKNCARERLRKIKSA